MADAPVILLPCQTRPKLPAPEALRPDIAARYGDEQRYLERIRGAGIRTAVQNIILAGRALGLGTTITTNHVRSSERCEIFEKRPIGIRFAIGYAGAAGVAIVSTGRPRARQA